MSKWSIGRYTLLHASTEWLCVCDHTASLRISDFSTTLKCLASGKTSIELLIPIDSQKTSVVEP